MPDKSFLNSHRSLGRRKFLRGTAAALGGTVATAAGLRTAGARELLGLDLPYSSAPFEPDQVPAQRGGHLRIAMRHSGTADTLEPGNSYNDFMIVLGGGVLYDTLTETAPDLTLQAGLAESWEVSQDAKTWTFSLRHGISFHNGKDLEADDVVSSIRHHTNGENNSAAKSLLSDISSIDRLDRNTVRITLSKGSADFAKTLSNFHMVIFPSGTSNKEFGRGIGTGPYVLEKFEPGVGATARRNDNDYRSDRGYFDSVELVAITDEAAAVRALLSGQVDVVSRLEPDTARTLQNRANIKVIQTPSNQHYTFSMRTDQSPFNDRNVRLALKHAINRHELLESLLKGFGTIGNDHSIGPANLFHAPPSDIGQHSYDPDKARHFLRQAGRSSLSVSLSVSDAAFAGSTDAGDAYRRSARECGIEIDVSREPTDGFWSNIWMKKPWVASYWGGRPTEDSIFTIAYESNAPWNETFWKNSRFDRLLHEARIELDNNRRRELYKEMQIILRDDGGAVVPVFANNVFAVSDKLQHGPQMSGEWNMDGGRLPSRWWFG